MARIGGRNAWLAVPAGLVCLGVVAALVWLATPMVPTVVQWGGDTLRAATTPKPVPADEVSPVERAADSGDFDCRELYPDALWSELTWHGQALLAQSKAAPTTAVTELADVLQPDVRVTCAWRLSNVGEIATTLALVGDDALLLADASLRGQGFACEAQNERLHCTRTREGVVESHSLAGGMWLSSVETTWHPEAYAARLDRYVWG